MLCLYPHFDLLLYCPLMNVTMDIDEQLEIGIGEKQRDEQRDLSPATSRAHPFLPSDHVNVCSTPVQVRILDAILILR